MQVFSKKKSLFLCSTPLQARICLGIIQLNSISNYDVVYCTRHNTQRDKSYFERLSDNSQASYYYYTEKKQKGLNSFAALRYIRNIPDHLVYEQYDYIYIASIDNYFFRYIIKAHPESLLVGFDDGTANITPSSTYFNLDERKRTKIINKILNLSTPRQVLASFNKHYTIYPNFKNLIESNKLIFINIFDIPKGHKDAGKTISFFIGQPFNAYLTDEEINKLKQYLIQHKPDYYITHPREKTPIINNATIIDKDAQLAEDIILEASKTSNVNVVAGYSTVLFNLSNSPIDCTYLSVSNKKEEQERCFLIKKTGSTIVEL